jgi:predicted DNA-binding transcriptional regulator AlpA
MDQSIEKLLDDRDVAEVLKVSPETIADWRKSDTVPLSFVRIGPRLVRYRASDLKAFIDAGHQPEAEAA